MAETALADACIQPAVGVAAKRGLDCAIPLGQAYYAGAAALIPSPLLRGDGRVGDQSELAVGWSGPRAHRIGGRCVLRSGEAVLVAGVRELERHGRVAAERSGVGGRRSVGPPGVAGHLAGSVSGEPHHPGKRPGGGAIATGNTLEPLLGAFLLSRVGFRRNLGRIRDVAALVVLAGLLSTTVSATIGVASLAADGLVRHGMLFSTWRVWWLGDLGGVVLVASALLVLTASPRPPRRRLWQAEAAALSVALAAVSVIAFSGGGLRTYATLPLLFWAALRFGQPGAVCGGLLVAALATWFTAHGQGPFLGGTPDSELLRSQTFVAIATVTALLVGAARSEQRSSEEAEANLREVLSAQRRQAEALREAEERFRGAFENAAIGMALVAPDGRWLRVNPAVCAIVGYSEEEMLARSFQDITHPDDLDADLEGLRRMLSGDVRSYRMDKRYIHRDGHVVWITLSVSLVHDPAGEPLYFVTQVEDITERKRSHMALEANVEIARAVAGETELGRVLELIAEQSRSLVDASGLAIMLADGDHFVVAATAGTLAKTLVGRRVEARGSMAERVCATGQARAGRAAGRFERLRAGPAWGERDVGARGAARLPPHHARRDRSARPRCRPAVRR